ncbi:hypothetical protein JKY72_06025 [Candidatus Gracilibacteria bacterium]|nr:hypothetical protein [Candidatus Gracilibacteria bacterium]
MLITSITGLTLSAILFGFSARYLLDHRLEAEEPSTIRDIAFAVFVSGALFFIIKVVVGSEGPVAGVFFLVALVVPLFIVRNLMPNSRYFRDFGYCGLVLGVITVAITTVPLFMGTMSMEVFVTGVIVSAGLGFVAFGIWVLDNIFSAHPKVHQFNAGILSLALVFASAITLTSLYFLGIESIKVLGFLTFCMAVGVIFLRGTTRQQAASSPAALAWTFLIAGLFNIFTPLLL